MAALGGMLLFLAGCCSVKKRSAPELPSGRALQLSGGRLFVRQTGAGPDVVLLHGLGDSSVGWQFVEPGLVRAGYRVLVWDALGAGRSEKPAGGDYSIAGHVKRLDEMLAAVGVRRAVLVGHSLGGAVALAFAERNPDKVQALCLIDPAAYRAGAMGGRWFWTTPGLADAVMALLPDRAITEFGLRQNFHDRGAISDELRSLYLREAERTGAIGALLAQERQLIPPHPEQWEAAHRAIRKPTLILWGQADRLVPSAQGQRLAGDIPGSRLVLFPGVGHSPHLEAPGLVLGQVVPFLKEACSGGVR